MNAYIKKHKKHNPDSDVKELRRKLTHFKKRKSQGERCMCGNPIWIIGSAFLGKGCFTCLTGESYTDSDYEIK